MTTYNNATNTSNPSGVSAGTYNTANITVNAAGIITAASSGSSGSGLIVQVVSTTITGLVTTTSTSGYVDVTGLSASITPATNTHKVLITGHISLGPVASVGAIYQIVRTSTAICVGTGGQSNQIAVTGGVVNAANSNTNFNTCAFTFEDSPATSSSVTYKLQFYAAGYGGTCAVNGCSGDSNDKNFPRGTSTITLMEVVA